MAEPENDPLESYNCDIKHAFMAGLSAGTRIARNIADWLEGQTVDLAMKNIEAQKQAIIDDVEENGLKPRLDGKEDSDAQEQREERSTGLENRGSSDIPGQE